MTILFVFTLWFTGFLLGCFLMDFSYKSLIQAQLKLNNDYSKLCSDMTDIMIEEMANGEGRTQEEAH